AEARRQDARRFLQRGGKEFVIGWVSGGLLREQSGLTRGQLLDDFLEGCAVRLREQDIEAHDGGAFSGELDEEIAKLGPRRGPLQRRARAAPARRPAGRARRAPPPPARASPRRTADADRTRPSAEWPRLRPCRAALRPHATRNRSRP